MIHIKFFFQNFTQIDVLESFNIHLDLFDTKQKYKIKLYTILRMTKKSY